MLGFLCIHKPIGLTSHQVVARVRRLVAKSVRVGHAGTLDPMATGVLPVALGPATRLLEYATDREKGYRALIRLGVTTETDDVEGAVLTQHAVPSLSPGLVETYLAPFRGPLAQIPPMYAAIHHQGERLYDLARRGVTVERAPRLVEITRLELLSIPDATSLQLDVTCSKGTYIRSLARDIGELMGCGAHLAGLERTFVGMFTLEDAVTLESLQADPSLLQQALLPPETVLRDWFRLDVGQEDAARLYNGVAISAMTASTDISRARAHAPSGALLAILSRSPDGALWLPEKVLKT